MLLMFLDESGDNNLTKIDQQYPVFILGGCIINEKYYTDVAIPMLREYKMKLFGIDNFILHTADICRRKGIFRKLKEKSFRIFFYDETNKLMENLNYKVVACVIRKNEHLARYGKFAKDSYL